MRTYTKHKEIPTFEGVTQERLDEFGEWIGEQVETALSARYALEKEWLRALRLYEGIPKQESRNVPVENAPNLEVTLGAIAVDAIYATAIDLVNSMSPPLVARARHKDGGLLTKGMQKFVDHVAGNEMDILRTTDDAFMDAIQLGTFVYYVPWTRTSRKNKVEQFDSEGPRAYAHPVEDFLTPGGAIGGDQDQWPWGSLRFYYTEDELKQQAKKRGLDIDGVQAFGAVGWVKTQRERVAKTHRSTEATAMYEIHDFYCYYDLDGDGVEEELLVVWDRGSRSILKYGYNPYDRRPWSYDVYQKRAHLVNGLGVMEMMRPYQEEVTELHNHQILNVLLANSRVWVTRDGAFEGDMKIWPGKNISAANPKEDIAALPMGDIYQSLPQAQSMTIALAERRVGTNELSAGRPSQLFGSRTPATTAGLAMQATNRRFASAFNNMRRGMAGAVKQGLYRYQERLLAGDKKTEKHIMAVIGDEEQAQVVIEALKNKNFDNMVDVEVTASSASINKDADKQNMLLLVNVLSTYYQQTLQLIQIASSPEAPEPVKETAKLIADKAGEIIDRTLRTFDNVRDPEALIVDVENELDGLDVSQEGMAGLGNIMQMLGQMGGGPQGGQQPLV